MKIDITIKDATVEQATEIMAKINGSSKVEAVAAPVAPVQNLKAAPVGAEIKPQEPVENNTTEAAPAQNESPAPKAEVNVELDAEGYPWDKRIHSSNKKQKADGTWNKRRGVDDAEWEAVRAELKAAQAPAMPSNPIAEEHPVAPAETQQPVQQTPAQQPAHVPGNVPMPHAQQTAVPSHAQTPPMPNAQQPEQPAQAAVPSHAQTPAQQPPASVQGGDFNALLTKIQQGMQGGVIDPAYMNSVIGELNTQFGVQMNAITDIMTNQPMIDATFAIMARDGK